MPILLVTRQILRMCFTILGYRVPNTGVLSQAVVSQSRRPYVATALTGVPAT